MKSLATILCLALVLLLSGFSTSLLAGPSTSLGGGPIVAQYSSNTGNNYGNSSSNNSSSRTRVRSYRGLFKVGAFVIFLIVSGIGFMIRKMSGN